MDIEPQEGLDFLFSTRTLATSEQVHHPRNLRTTFFGAPLVEKAQVETLLPS